MVARKSSSRGRKENRVDEDMKDIFDGPLNKRRYGLRIDDDIEVQIIAGNTLITLEGRVLSMKNDLEILDVEGNYHKIFMDWIVDIKLIEHNRPRPEKDPEITRRRVKQKPKKKVVDHAYN